MFQKFSKIKHDYDGKNINAWVKKFPELMDQAFVITEKIDGANFQIMFDENGERTYASRNKSLVIDEAFFNWQQVLLQGDCLENLESISELFKNDPDILSLHLYGELFGEGIQKRIDYGEGKHFLPFSMKINGSSISHADMTGLLSASGCPEWKAPVLAVVDSLDEALAFEVEEVETKIGEGKGNRQIEGIVIESYETAYTFENVDGESVFRLKKKSKGFCDQAKVKHKLPKEEFEGGPMWAVLKLSFIGYFTENRLNDLFSKEGPIESMDQIGKYIPLFVKDVREDFLSEHQEEFIMLDDKEKKNIMSCAAGLIVPMLKEAL